jgi:hypothetical protein
VGADAVSGVLVQVVPGLEPTGGVASHARTLARALEREASMASQLLAAPGDRGGDAAKRLLDQLAAADGAPVLVHYSNYGYDRRGCPRWLIAGLARWRALRPGSRLVTVFHEVYATGWPWQSSFWLSLVQRRLAARLHRLSDRALTSLHRYGEMLRAWDDRPVVTLPVFSTVGEPPSPPPLATRRRRLVVFGSAGLRRRAYAESARELGCAGAALAVEEIVDVGPGMVAPPAIDQLPVRAMGEQPAEMVSALLADSVGGMLCYPESLVAKSTVFAAYAAHRLVPVCVWPEAKRGERRAHGGDRAALWNPRRAPADSWQAIADAAYGWYQGHSLATHAALYAELLR